MILFEPIIRHKKLRLTCKELPSSCTAFKNYRKLLTPGAIFAVNRYECFTENKKIIRTYCSFKPSKKSI